MIEVLDSGFHITIQDSGRYGFSKYGVPSSGYMDSISACNANSLVGNSNDEAVFEITMMGGRFVFHSDISIAISGAIFETTLNNKSIVNNNKIDVKKGDEFNADDHEAVTQIPAPSKDMVGKIMDIIEKGYKLGEKVIRYPKVVIGK